MLNKWLTRDAIQVQARASDWREAIKRAAEPLRKNDSVGEEYVEAMISNVEKLGPYIAIAPRIAIPHARPEQGVNRSGMSLLTLKEPVPFGDKPVQLLIVLAAADSDSHIGALAELTELISDEDNVETMISAQSSEIIASLIERLFEN